MDEYNILIQALLLKKEKECGELSQLTSAITQENAIYIKEILEEITAICKSINLPIELNNLHENPRCINAYKYLALNTNFKCLDLLKQDNANNHLVDICPLLSPYLFIEIIWQLRYEDILCESLLYIPVDFVIEIVEIVRRCIGLLHCDRALRLIRNLIIKCYEKLMLIKINGSQSIDITKNVDAFVIHIQELLQLFLKPSFTKLEEIDEDELQYERQGIILKRVLDITITCLKYQNETIIVSPTMDKHYKITFGHEIIHKYNEDQININVVTLCKDMVNILLKLIKEITCNCYISWHERNDIEDPLITLQQAVGIKCYNIKNFLQNCINLKENEYLFECLTNEHLLECLERLQLKPDTTTEAMIMPLTDLISEIKSGKMEHKKELFRRCQEWNETTLEELKQHDLIVDEKMCLMLLDYIVCLKSDKEKESHAYSMYLYCCSLMYRLEMELFMKTIINYIIKYDGSDILETVNTETCFKNFICANPNLNNEKDCKKALMFMLSNVKKYMTKFVKIFLGDTSFINCMLPMQEILYFISIMEIKDKDNNYLILASLRDILLEESSVLNPVNVNNIVELILSCTSIENHDFVNMLCTPYLLAETYPQNNLYLVLHIVIYLWANINLSKVDLKKFFQGVGKKLSAARKDTKNLRVINSQVIIAFHRLFDHPHNEYILKMVPEEKTAILMFVEPYLEPLDRTYFIERCLNWIVSDENNIIRDYERRFFCAKFKILNSNKFSQELKHEISNFGLLVEDFIRHMILRCTELEIRREGWRLTEDNWKFLNSDNPPKSYAQFCRITMEACQLCLEYPNDFAKCAFSYLLTCFSSFTENLKNFSTRITLSNTEYISTYSESIKSLQSSISGTPYVDKYEDMIVRFNNELLIGDMENYDLLKKLCIIVQQFTLEIDTLCDTDIHRYKFSKRHSSSVTKFRVAYNVINATMMITKNEITDCLLHARQCFSIR